MKLKLIYTGKPEETRIVNAETGEMIDNAVSVALEIDAFGCNALIQIRDLQLELDNVEAIAVNHED
jgi:hypothetical protein